MPSELIDELAALVPKLQPQDDVAFLALTAAPVLDRLATLARPLVWLLSRSVKLVVRVLGGDPAVSRGMITEQELRDLVTGTQALSADERQIVGEVFDAGKRQIREVLVPRTEVVFLDEPTIGLDVIAKQRIRDLLAQLHTEEGVTVFLTSHDAGDIEQICRRAIVINHGEIILDAPVAKLKREYLKAKTVDLLLEESAEKLLKTDPESGKQRLSIQLPTSIHEEMQETEGVRVLKAKGHGLKLEIDTSRCPLEPVIAAIMQYCHILDMTIADPPMEEIIATNYGKEGRAQMAIGEQQTEPTFRPSPAGE